LIKRAGWMRYGFAVLVVAATVLLKLVLARTIEGETPFLLLFFAVLVSAWRGGAGPGLLATGLATLAASYFFIPPINSFSIENIGQAVRLIQFILEGAFTTFLVAALQSSRRKAEERTAEVQEFQQHLRENEERSRRLAEEVVEGLALAENGKIIDANKTFTRMFGYELDELVGMNIVELVVSEDRELVTGGILTENLDTYEVRALRKDGTSFPAEVRPRFMDYQGRRVWVSSVMDLTERKQDEEARRFLDEAGATLSSSLDYEMTLSRVARLTVPRLADWCVVDVVGGGDSLERLTVVHQDPEKVKLARELQENYPPDPESSIGLPQVLRTGQSQIMPEIPESVIEETARDGRHREILRELGLRSFMIVPLVVRGRTLGAITLVMAESGRRYGQEDLAQVEELARRAAVAVDNARLYREVQRELSERQSVETALRQQRDLYETLLQTQSEVGEGFVIADGMSIFYANEAFCQITGYTERELQEMPSYFDLFLPGQRVMFMERFEQRMSGGETMDHQEISLLRKDGRQVELEIAVKMLQAEEINQFIIIAREITERKQAEEELKYRERGLAAAQRIARMGNFEYDIREDQARWSDELYRIFGYMPQEFIPRYKTFLRSAHPKDRQYLRRSVRDALRTGEPASIEYRIVRPDGVVRVVETQYEVTQEGGRPAYLIGTVQDVTERRETERQAREAELRFQTLVEQIPAVTYIQEIAGPDDSGEPKPVMYMSPQYKDILGYVAEQEILDEDHWIKIMHPEDRERVLAEDERTDATGEPFRMEYRQFARDGSLVWIRDEAVLVRDDEGKPLHWQGVQYDITEQKQIEEELEERAKELARSNAELERFAYIASHDLQEPLRMVSSYTQLLARRYKGRLDQDADEFIEYAVDGATRMQTLINDLLVYSRIGTRGNDLAPTDLSLVLELTRSNLQIAIEESGAIVTSDLLPTVAGDQTQLIQLFQNLIGNAIKFRDERPPEVHVGAERRGREWLISVRDNGIGLDPQYKEKIFTVFQRLHTKEEYSGTGIGLAVCKKIVERHGGRIWVESKPGEGSTFFFTMLDKEGDRR